MRIAFVNSTTRWGGVKTWMLTFAKKLLERGHTVKVYGRQKDFVSLAKETINHGEHVSFGPDLNPIAIFLFLQEFRKHKIDVVIINVGKDLATAGVAAKIAGIPVVQRLGLPQDIPYRVKTHFLHWLIKPLFLCPCMYIANGFLMALSYVKSQDVHIVFNGKKVWDGQLEQHSPRRFICTQQLEPNKGHAILLEAFSQVVGPFELHILGTGSSEKMLKDLADSLGLSKKVFFHGFYKDVTCELRKGDIFLLASLSEGLPNTLLEAMANGLLPIMRLVGGVHEVLIPELYDWVLPANAVAEDFREYIQKALALSDQELLKLREASRNICIKNFDIDDQASKLEDWLHGVTCDKR